MGRVIVRVWSSKKQDGDGIGHVSIETNAIYASFWPSSPIGNTRTPDNVGDIVKHAFKNELKTLRGEEIHVGPRIHSDVLGVSCNIL